MFLFLLDYNKLTYKINRKGIHYAQKEKVLRIAVYIILIVAILAILIPVIISTGYTYPCEDDFGYEADGKIYANRYGSFLGALVGSYEYYMGWQETYVPNFLLYFIRAYDRWNIIGFHLVMIIVLLLFIWAVFLLVKTLARDKISMLILALTTYIIIFNSSKIGLEKEFFYWYTGALTYQLAFALSCITLALALRLKNEENKKRLYFLMVTSIITGFLASGGTLEVASFNCSWLLLELVLCYKEISPKKIIATPFISSFIGALINACARGNFTRSNLTMGGINYSILNAIKDTFSCWRYEWNSIFDSKFLIVLFSLIFIACLICKTQIFQKGISTEKMLLLIPAIFLIQYFTAFPVILGYHSSALIYSRTTYTYELLTKLTLLFGLICFAQWLREHTKHILVPIATALIVIILVIPSNNILKDISNGFSYQAAKELHNGSIQELYEFRLNVLSLLEYGEEGTDVYLKVPMVPHSNIMYGMGITTDPNCNCNHSAARYYGFNSLIIEYSDKYTFSDLKYD